MQADRVEGKEPLMATVKAGGGTGPKLFVLGVTTELSTRAVASRQVGEQDPGRSRWVGQQLGPRSSGRGLRRGKEEPWSV